MKPRPIAWFLGEPKAPIFAEESYTIRIEDEAAGEFVVVESYLNGKPEKMGLDPENWPALRDAIEIAVNACRKGAAE